MEQFRVLILGELKLGERNDREDSGEWEAMREALQPFTETCDLTLVHLTTPGERRAATDPDNRPGVTPSGGHHRIVEQLRDLNVDAVSLANARASSLEDEEFQSLLGALNESNVSWFGGGTTLLEAAEPYRVDLPLNVGGGQIHFHSSSEQAKPRGGNSDTSDASELVGCAPLSIASLPWARSDDTLPDSFHVAFPRWGNAKTWRNRRQFRLAHRFLRKDYDLVIGHGSANIQEVNRIQQRWVVYGVGSANRELQDSRPQDNDEDHAPPYSFWSILEIQKHDGERRVSLKLYPIYADEEASPQTGPITEADFERLRSELRSRPSRPWRFDNPAQRPGNDELGFFFRLDLGGWPAAHRPARLEPIVESGDPGDWPTRGPSTEVEDKIMTLSKTVGAGMLALSAESKGGRARWLDPNLVLVELPDRRFLTYQYKAHESILGAATCIDKVLSAQFFEAHGVRTPKTMAVNTVEEAVGAASEIGGAVVVKPRRGSKSRGVSTGLVHAEEIRAAFLSAKNHGEDVIVQQHVEASEELRVMASPSEAVAVIRRVPPHVVGDGISTVQQLISDKNEQRTLNPSLRSGRPIPVDTLTEKHLHQQGHSLQSSIDIGRMITVRSIAALSVGADAHQALEGSGPDVKETAAAAVGAIPGLGWGGVDLIIEKDTSVPYVIEINTNAAYGAALFPTYGQPRNVAEKVWELRHAATALDVHGTPIEARVASPAQSLASGRKLPQAHEPLTFSTLLTESLLRNGYQIKPTGSSVQLLTSPTGATTWSTDTGFTAEDRSIVWQVMRRHRLVRELLKLASVPTPRGREVSSAAMLKEFTEGRTREVVLLPPRGAWTDSSCKILAANEVMNTSSLRKSTWVQTHPEGSRLRILASPEETWAILAQPDARPVGPSALSVAGRVAVEAIRAVPELRWAAVDVVVRQKRVRDGRAGGVLVEGMTIAPQFSPQATIIAGSLDSFFAHILKLQ